MSFRDYTNHPFIDIVGSFADAFDQSQACGGRWEGGRGGRGRGGHFRHPHHWHRHRSDQTSDIFVPKVDIYSTENEYKVYISLPSAEKETLELKYDPNTRELGITGTILRPAEFADLDDEALQKVLIHGERKVGKFERKLPLPPRENFEDGERIKFQEASAKFENGVLELTVPKVEKEGPQTIVID
jgi:HSP20 family protein